MPFVYVGENTLIGDGTIIHPHSSIMPGARIGKNNEIFEGCVIAATPQDFRWKGEESYVIIGDNNKIREQVIINRSIYQGLATTIGNQSFIMAQSHIGHDSFVGDHCVLGNAVKIAGNVKVNNYTILSSHALIHEKCELGEWVLVKGGCRINGNVPPYVIMSHNPCTYSGVNAHVMRYSEMFDEDKIEDIAKCYRHIYQTNTSLYNALKRIEDDVEEGEERDAILNFARNHNLKLAALPKIGED